MKESVGGEELAALKVRLALPFGQLLSASSSRLGAKQVVTRNHMRGTRKSQRLGGDFGAPRDRFLPPTRG
jgi:hypothetical protein